MIIDDINADNSLIINPRREMDTIHTFEVTLRKLNIPNAERVVQINSTDAVRACAYANKIYKDWYAQGAMILE